MRLDLTLARHLIDAGLRRAEERDMPSAVAVVDAGGNLLAFAAHPDAILAARDLAIGKAYTSVSLRVDSGKLSESTAPGGPFHTLSTALPQRPIVAFDGGRPLPDPHRNRLVLGAVGASGGTLDDDADISAAMVEAYRSFVEQHITEPK